eukprot:1175754-Prorocentrum_minimum.AAC.2
MPNRANEVPTLENPFSKGSAEMKGAWVLEKRFLTSPSPTKTVSNSTYFCARRYFSPAPS